MARLPKGQRANNTKRIETHLKRSRYGVKESELAQDLGWQPRRTNNYLRALAQAGKAEKDGWLWFWKR